MSRGAALLFVVAVIGLVAPVDALGAGPAGRIRGRAVDAGTRQLHAMIEA